jgi:GxxExxY protein
MQDRKRQDMQDKNQQPYFELTEMILGCCFDIMNELGSGFLESVYKNALFIALKEKGLKVTTEKKFEVLFRGCRVGLYIADLVVEESVIVELKCCEVLIGEHQAQLINYLKASGVLVGLLVNFGNRKIEYKRLHHPVYPTACDPAYPEIVQ